MAGFNLQSLLGLEAVIADTAKGGAAVAFGKNVSSSHKPEESQPVSLEPFKNALAGIGLRDEYLPHALSMFLKQEGKMQEGDLLVVGSDGTLVVVDVRTNANGVVNATETKIPKTTELASHFSSFVNAGNVSNNTSNKELIILSHDEKTESNDAAKEKFTPSEAQQRPNSALPADNFKIDTFYRH